MVLSHTQVLCVPFEVKRNEIKHEGKRGAGHSFSVGLLWMVGAESHPLDDGESYFCLKNVFCSGGGNGHQQERCKK